MFTTPGGASASGATCCASSLPNADTASIVFAGDLQDRIEKRLKRVEADKFQQRALSSRADWLAYDRLPNKIAVRSNRARF